LPPPTVRFSHLTRQKRRASGWRLVAISISAVVLLGILVFIFVKKSGLNAAHAIVCTLFGFFLASTSMAPSINRFVTNIADMVGQIRF
jgi:flagellar motor component MotA